MSFNPINSNLVPDAGGAASAAPRLVLSQLATFGNVVGSTATFKGKILDPTKIVDLKMKYQQFYKLVGDFFNIEGEVYSFILDPETQGEMKGFLKVRSTVLDRSNPAAPPKEVIRLFNLPLLAIQLSDDEFNQLNTAYQAICEAQLGRKAPNGLKKSFSRQLNAQSLEDRPFFGSDMLKGKEVNAFLNVENATQLNTLLSLNKAPEEIQKIQKQLDLATKSGLVKKGHEPAVLLALFGIDPAGLKDIFKPGEQPEKHWYSALGLGADTAKKNHAMAHRMIDKIIAECQAFSLDPQVQQEASRFFSDSKNLNIFQKQYNPPKVNDLDILFCGEKKEWKLHQEWLDHFNRFALNDQEKLELLKSFNTWRGEDYRAKLAQEADPHQRDAYFQTQDPTDRELDSFLTGIATSDDQKDQKLKAALKASLKEGKTLKDLSLQQLVEKVGGSDLARKVQIAAQTAQAQARTGQLPAQLTPQHRQAPVSANPPQASTDQQSSGRGAHSSSSVSSQPQAGGGAALPGLRNLVPPSSPQSTPPLSRKPSFESLSSDASVAGVGMHVQEPSSFSGSSQPASRSSSPVPPQAPSPQLNQQQQMRYDWIQSIYDSLHRDEVLEKQDLQPLYGFDIGRDRSYLEDVFAQKRRLDPHLDGKRFIDSYSEAIGWAKSMLDKHLKNWIQAKDASFTDDAVNVLKSSPRIRPLLDALAQAYDPRVTKDKDQKTRTLGVLGQAKWDQKVLDNHKQGIQLLLSEWDQHAIHSHQEAAPLKAEFLAKSHQNLQGELNAFNDRVQTHGNEFQYQQYEIETNFTGSPSFEDWAKRPENAYDTLVAKESDSFNFKQALQKPEIKKAFLERCKEFREHMNFEGRYRLLTQGIFHQMSHYPAEEQAKFFEEFIPSPQRVSFDRWLNDKEYAVAKEALEEFTQGQTEIFQEVFKDKTFKNLFIQSTQGKDFREKQGLYFIEMQQFILHQTGALQVGTITQAQIADLLRKELSEAFQRSPWNPS